MQLKAVILGAGKGTRMLPLTKTKPKALLPSKENSLLLNQIKFLRTYTSEIIVTVGYMKNEMLKALKSYGIENYIIGENLDNAFWINHSFFNNYNGPLIVITCDNVLDININKLIEEYYENNEKSILVGVKGSSENADKVIFSKNNIEEISKNISSKFFLSGLQVLNISELQEAEEQFNNFNDVWSYLISKKRLILSQLTPKSWFAIDTPDELASFYNL
jgi:NDP-sugar pyrophosphorylase family protein